MSAETSIQIAACANYIRLHGQGTAVEHSLTNGQLHT